MRKTKDAKQLIEDYLITADNMPIDGMVLMTKFECEVLMEQFASQELIKELETLTEIHYRSNSMDFRQHLLLKIHSLINKEK